MPPVEFHPRFTKTGLATQSQIRKLETQLGSLLPADYAKFLMETNGGLPKTGNFRVNGQMRSVQSFAHLDNGILTCDTSPEYWSLQFEYVHFQRERPGLLPPDVLVIGREELDHPIMLSLSPETLGSISMAFVPEGGPRAYETPEKTYPIADSFSSFYASLE